METVAWRRLSCSSLLFDFGLAKIMTWLRFEVVIVLLVSSGGEDFLVGIRFRWLVLFSPVNLLIESFCSKVWQTFRGVICSLIVIETDNN